MKPEIDTTDFYTILFDSIEYVNYFQEISDEQFDKILEMLRSIAFILNDESFNLFDFANSSLDEVKKMIIDIVDDSER